LLRLPAVEDNAAMQAERPKADSPKRKRHRFQFSLRTLLIFTMVCAVACGWLGKRIEQKRKEREGREAIVSLGGSVRYDYQDGNGKPPGPDWLRDLAGENFFSAVVEVRLLGNPNVGDAELAHLEGMPQLQVLNIFATNVTDAGLLHLKGLTRLKRLYLGNTRVTDAGLTCLRGLNQLQEMSLWKTKVTNAGLEHVEELANLRELYLHSTNISDAGLAHLKRLNQLERIDLAETEVTEAGVNELQKALPNCIIIH
jgi:hypothetical protein